MALAVSDIFVRMGKRSGDDGADKLKGLFVKALDEAIRLRKSTEGLKTAFEAAFGKKPDADKPDRDIPAEMEALFESIFDVKDN